MNQWLDNHWVEAGIRIAIVIVIGLIVRFIAERAVRRAVMSSSTRLFSVPATALQETAKPSARKKPLKFTDPPRAAAVLAASGASPEERAKNRAETLSRTLCLLIDWTVGIVVVLTVLSEAGVSLAPLLTSAGVSGIIIGFGAQSLIKDLLAGIFLVVEGQYSIGDTIDTGTVRGVVQEIGSRVTRLQSADGEIWYVRHGDISTLGNQSQGWVASEVDITVNAGSDPDHIIAVLNAVVEDLENDADWHDRMLRPPQVLGLTSFDTKQMVFSIRVFSPRASGVEREVRARAVAALATDAE